MPTLYLTEQGSKLRKTGDRLLVEIDGATLLEVECHRIDAAFTFGNVQITTQALHELLSHGIELALLSQNGTLLGQLTPPAGKNIDLRRAQYRLAEHDAWCANFARTIVQHKINSAIDLLRDADWNSAATSNDDARKTLENTRDRVAETDDLEELLGLEGTAAREYFACFAQLAPVRELGFTARKRRPPPDPFNATLSFGYAMLGALIQSQLDARGFDPYLGYLHKPDYGRASLAQDILELYRAPVVDRLAIKLFNLKSLQPDDFEPDDAGGVRFSRDALKKFLRQWESHLARLDLRSTLREQSDALARYISGADDHLAIIPLGKPQPAQQHSP